MSVISYIYKVYRLPNMNYNPSRLRLRVGTDALPFNKFAIDEVGIEELMDKAEQLHRKIENSAKIALNSP
jgi:hypothetical protein